MRNGKPTRWLAFGTLVALAAGGIGVASAASSSGGSVLNPIGSCRLADTRPAPDNVGPRATPIGANEEVVFDVHGVNGECTIPDDATSITANMTIVNPTVDSFLATWPEDEANPGTSVLNWVAGQAPTPNAVTVKLSAAGAIRVYNAFGEVDVVIDVTGFFAPHDHDDRYYTKAEVDATLGALPSVDGYTKAEVDAALGEKADQSTTYTKSEVDAALGDKADQSTTYTKSEVDGLLPTATYTTTATFTCSGGATCTGGSYAAPLAACSAGDLVTGGAATRTSTTSAFAPQDHIAFPAGAGTPTGWTTTNALNIGDGNVITVYAICLDIT